MHDTPPKNFQIWSAMCFLKVKDGHLTILTNCPYPSFWPELPNCLDLNFMMDGFTIVIYINLIGKGKEKMLDWSFKKWLLCAQVSQLTFYIFVKVGYYPLLPLACAYILVYTVVVYCIWSHIVIVIRINWLKVIILFFYFVIG